MSLRLAVWSGPRNISTAMMRAWESRGDCAVVDEPLYAHYLGDTFDFDYSLMHAFTYPDSRLQVGLVGYGARQTTAKTGPNITPAQEAQRYRVNALGLGLHFAPPARKVTLRFKYFDEFSNQWTYQGYSLQISAGIGF